MLDGLVYGLLRKNKKSMSTDNYIIITSSPQKSSLTDFFYELSIQFVKRGYKVIIIFDQKLVRNESNDTLIYKTWPSYRPTSLKDFLFLKKIILKYRPTHIISSFGAVNISIITGFFFGVKNRIAWNHTKSNQLIVDSKNKFKTFLFRLRKVVILNLFATEVHTNSIDTRNDINAYLKFPKSKIKVVYFLLKKKTFNNCNKDKIISFIGRFSPSKGQIILLKAIPKIIKKHPDFKFYFVGSGIDKDKIENLAKQMKLQDYCFFIGGVNQEMVYKILSNSKLHVSASVDEAFGMVNLEAISVGTPILAHKVGGIKEILEEGINGFFFETNNSNDLSEKIISILNDSNLYDQLQKGAKSVFESKFLLNEKNLNKRIDLILS